MSNTEYILITQDPENQAAIPQPDLLKYDINESEKSNSDGFDQCVMLCCSTIYIVIPCLVIFVLDLVSIMISANNMDASCDAFQPIRLSRWLLIFGIIDCLAIAVYFSINIIAVAMSFNPKTRDVGFVLKFIFSLSYAAFTLTMVTLGIISLHIVFPQCVVEAYSLTCMSIIMIVSKFLSLFPLYKNVLKKN